MALLTHWNGSRHVVSDVASCIGIDEILTWRNIQSHRFHKPSVISGIHQRNKRIDCGIGNTWHDRYPLETQRISGEVIEQIVVSDNGSIHAFSNIQGLSFPALDLNL